MKYRPQIVLVTGAVVLTAVTVVVGDDWQLAWIPALFVLVMWLQFTPANMVGPSMVERWPKWAMVVRVVCACVMVGALFFLNSNRRGRDMIRRDALVRGLESSKMISGHYPAAKEEAEKYDGSHHLSSYNLNEGGGSYTLCYREGNLFRRLWRYESSAKAWRKVPTE